MMSLESRPLTPEHKPSSSAVTPYQRRSIHPRAKATALAAANDASKAIKRKKHADAERTRSHRKENEVMQMRDMVVELERVFATLQEQRQRQVQLQPPPGSPAAAMARLRDQYVQALMTSGSLRREKQFLQPRMQEFGIVNAAIQTMLSDYDVPNDKVLAQTDGLMRDFELHEKLHSKHCYEMMRDLYEESHSFATEGKRISSGSTAMGWTDKRTLKGTEVNFWLSKVIHSAPMEEMMNNTWLAFHNFEYCRKIFPTTANLEVLQKISDDMFVLRRTISYVTDKTTYRCLNFVFRVKTPDGYFISCRTIKEPQRNLLEAKPNEEHNAINQFYWARFRQQPDGGCEVTFAGRMDNGKLDYARFMLIEIPISMMCWESTYARPLIQLTAL